VATDSGISKILTGHLAGDREAAWDRFLSEFAPLVLQIIYLFERDPDHVDDCFVFVCERLKRDGLRRLRRFDPSGPAGFPTWLRAVTRNLCLDWRRKRVGRPRPFRAIAGLPPLEKEVYRAIHLRGLTESEALQTVRLSFPQLTRVEFAASMARIEHSLSSRQAWLLASGRLREVSISSPARAGGDTPVQDPVDKGPSPEQNATREERARALRQALATLPKKDRLLLRLRYEQDLTLEEIARLTRIGSAVTAHRRIEGALDKLRAALAERDSPRVRERSTAGDVDG
jgi:RNA polymerase sigma factor (sigma-70 family)